MKVKITSTAEKQIKKLSVSMQKRVVKFLTERMQNHAPKDIGKALRGDKAEFWRYRVGDYRLICSIDETLNQITVMEVGHRKEIYR